MVPNRGICNRLLWMQDAFGLRPGEPVLHKTPIGFDVSVWELLWPLISGGRLVVAPPGIHREPDRLCEVIRRAKVSIVHFVPSMLAAFLQEPHARECTSLTRVFCSGEALTASLQRAFHELLPAELHNLYGPTEASIDVTHWACRRSAPEEPVPIGWPIANIRLYVFDDVRTPVPVGTEGELY